MIDRHVADLAELYALGTLDDDARAAVDAHVQHCPSCAAFIASAERDVALIASMESHRQAPPELQGRIERLVDTGVTPLSEKAYARRWTLPAALAAALIVGLLPSVYFWSENRSMHGAMLAQSAGRRDVRTRRVVVRRRRARQFKAAVGRMDARRYAHHAGRRDPARQRRDALPAEEPSHEPSRAHGRRSGRCRGGSLVAKNGSKSSRRSIRVAGGNAERIAAP
jgi:anti-sigma factor RsiW